VKSVRLFRRRGMFRQVPTIRRIELSAEPNRYRVELAEPGGPMHTVIFTLEDSQHGATSATSMVWDADVFAMWPGDADSRSAIMDQVRDFHRKVTVNRLREVAATKGTGGDV
jgi:hypothetical protein